MLEFLALQIMNTSNCVSIQSLLIITGKWELWGINPHQSVVARMTDQKA